MADESNSYRDVLSRRRFVELTGVSGAAALAGCDGASDGGTEGSGTEDSGTDEDSTEGGDSMQMYPDFALTNWVSDDNPNNLHFNMYNATGLVPFAQFLTYEPTAKWDYANGEYQMWAITEWELVDENTFEFTIDTDITWHDGDNLTSQDVKTQLRLEQVIGSELWDFTESIETPDDSTVRLNMPDGGNPQLIKIFLEGIYLNSKHSEFEQYLDAAGEDYDEETRQELQSLEIENPVGCGPFGDVSANQQRMTLNRMDNYYKSENINFGQYEMQYIQGNQSVWQELLGSNIDAVWSLFTPARIIANFPKSIIESRIPAYWGYGLAPQHEDEHLGNLNVRKAIMHVIDRNAVVENAAPLSKSAPDIPSCIAVSQIDSWIGDSRDEFETYGYSEDTPEDNVNTERAVELLQEEGYERQDGTWTLDGEPVEIPIMVPASWSDWVAATRTVADQLSQFGFDARVDAQGGSYWENAGSGDFKLAAWNWLVGGVNGSHPYFNASHQYNLSAGGMTANVEEPEEVTNALESLATATDSEEINSLVKELALISNQELPVMGIAEKLDQSFVNTDRLSAPEPSSDLYQTKWPSSWLVRTGELQADPQ